jgi:hypothetical protein
MAVREDAAELLAQHMDAEKLPSHRLVGDALRTETHHAPGGVEPDAPRPALATLNDQGRGRARGGVRRDEGRGVDRRQDVRVPDKHVARAQKRGGPSDASRRAEQLGLDRERDVPVLRVGDEKRLQLLPAMMGVDHDPADPRRGEPLQHMGQRRTIAHGDEGLGKKVGQRAQPRAQPGRKDHRREHVSSLAAKLWPRAKVGGEGAP